MTDWAGFILARVEEDGAAARECAKVYPGEWELSDRGWMATVRADEPDFRIVAQLDQDQVPRGTVAWLGDALAHIAANDPARVLAACTAYRAIVAEHAMDRFWPHVCEVCREDVNRDTDDQYPCPTIRALAAIWKDDPAYPGAETSEEQT